VSSGSARSRNADSDPMFESEGERYAQGVARSACAVIDDHGSSVTEFDREMAERLLASGSFFWLDLGQPTPEDFRILREVFRFHPLALEDSEQFDQRAKIDGYDDFVFMVVYGAGRDDDRLVEVHCFYSEHFLVTVHREECPALAEIRRRYGQRERGMEKPSLLLYHVLDGLVDSFFPTLARLDDRIDALEDEIFLKADEKQLQEMFQLKRQLVGMRKTVTPQRDAFASVMGGVAELPGLSMEAEHYFGDVYDHLIRISDLIDSYRDLLTGAMDVYLSTVSNRTNAVMKQLTIIATIFLPLTFVTGFFGQNFEWMVSNVDSWPMFLVLGVGTEIVALLALLVFFRRRGWFEDSVPLGDLASLSRRKTRAVNPFPGQVPRWGRDPMERGPSVDDAQVDDVLSVSQA
jgi:magnesium transporter